MKRLLLILSIMLLSATALFAQEKPYMVAFWNFENLFDIYDDPETHDEEFLPEGVKKWNEIKYQKKLSNMERVIFDITQRAIESPIFHTVLAVYHFRITAPPVPFVCGFLCRVKQDTTHQALLVVRTKDAVSPSLVV